MAENDTAVLDLPDTGTEEELSPEGETEALLDSPETEQADDDGPETDAPETLTREEAERLKAEAVEAAKAEAKAQQEAEREEAVATWQKAEAQKRRTQAATDRQGEAHARVTSLLQFVAKEVDAGRLTPESLASGLNPKVTTDIALRLDNMSFEHINQAHEETYDAYLGKHYPGFAIPAALAHQRERAVAANNWEAIAETKLAILEAALASKVEAKVRADIEAEQTDDKKAAALKAADTTRRTKAGPTNVSGGAPAPRATLETMDPRSPEYAKAYERKYGFKP